MPVGLSGDVSTLSAPPSFHLSTGTWRGFGTAMWNGRELEQKVARALDCIGQGAAALSEAGATVYSMSNAMQTKGLAGLLHSGAWKEGTEAPAPARAKVKSGPLVFQPQDDEETRAILKLRLERAMGEQDISRVQQLSRELDELEGNDVKRGSLTSTPFLGPAAASGDRASNEEKMRPDMRAQFTARALASSHDQGHMHSDLLCTSALHSSEAEVSPASMRHCSQCYRHRCCTRSDCVGDAAVDDAAHTNAADRWCTGVTRLDAAPATINTAACNAGSDTIELMDRPHEMRSPSVNHPRLDLTYRSLVIAPWMLQGGQTHHLHFMSENPSQPVEEVTFAMSPREREHNSCGSVVGRTSRAAPVSLYSAALAPSSMHETQPMWVAETRRSSGREIYGPSLSSSTTEMHRGNGREVMLLTMHSTSAQSYEVGREPQTEVRIVEDDVVGSSYLGVQQEPLHMPSHEEAHMKEKSHQLGNKPPSQPSSDSASDLAGQQDSRSASQAAKEPASQAANPDASQRASQAANQVEGVHPEGHGEDTGLPPLPDVYEVESVLKVRTAANGKREFLIKWRGWGHSWNNWEPEHHILDRRLLRKFNQRKRQVADPATDSTSQSNEELTIHSKRRCAKEATVKARLASQAEE